MTAARDDALARVGVEPDRVAYATGVLLDAGDFEAEQLYHRGRLARALAFLFGDGTVAGLEVVLEGDDRLVVRAGLAIDRAGRLVELPGDVCLRLDRWFDGQPPRALDAALHEDAGGVVADVFVRFVACARGHTPAFAAGPFDATDAVQPSRLRDGYEVRLLPRPEGDLPTRLPPPPWPEVAGDTPEARRAALQAQLFGAWRARTEGAAADDLVRGTLPPRAEHLADQDATAVFLARVTIPATRAADGARPVRGGAATVRNDGRRFVYPPAALARLAGVP